MQHPDVFGLDPLDAQAKITGAAEAVTNVVTSHDPLHLSSIEQWPTVRITL